MWLTKTYDLFSVRPGAGIVYPMPVIVPVKFNTIAQHTNSYSESCVILLLGY